nr:DUF5689 domain-containing protein [Pedobacter sp. ASV19]
MKTRTTIKQLLLVLATALGMISCKKDKKTDPPTSTPVQVITLTDLKALSTSVSVKVPDARKISGIVISDVNSKNTDIKTVIIQEATDKPGIVINFDAAQTFALGDQLEVNISNQTLAQVNGEIVLNNIPAANAKKVGTGTIVARQASADQILNNAPAWNGTLVTLGAGRLTGDGSGKYKGLLNYTDEKGTVKSIVLPGATFENTDYPASCATLTGIVRINGNDIRLDIRKAADATQGAISRIITEDFSTMTSVNDNWPDPDDHTNIGGGITLKGMGAIEWTTGNGYMRFVPSEGTDAAEKDAAFIKAAKKYLYIFSKDADVSSNKTEAYFATQCVNSELKDLKTVSVTFAASKASKFVPGFGQTWDIAPFDGTKDYAQITVAAIVGYAYSKQFYLPLSSPQIKKAGEFYTLTYKMPTKAELIAAGVDSNSPGLNNLINFTVVNTSRRTSATGFPGDFSMPVLIDKIEMGF